MKCHARQYSDQMVCGRCRLTWDTNDRDPPECKLIAIDMTSELPTPRNDVPNSYRAAKEGR